MMYMMAQLSNGLVVSIYMSVLGGIFPTGLMRCVRLVRLLLN